MDCSVPFWNSFVFECRQLSEILKAQENEAISQIWTG